MKVKEILEWASVELGVWETVKAYINGEANDVGEQETTRLVTAYNLVENELALDYFPLIKAETFENAEEGVAFARFANDPVRILRVKAFESGEEVPFTLFTDRLVAKGKVTVEYRYVPEAKATGDACEVGEKVTKHLLVYGVLANYLASVGEYVQASAWEKKYKTAMVLAQGISKGKTMGSRRWV